MDAAGRKSALAAVLLTALFVVLFVATLMADDDLMRHQTPVAVYGVLALLYAVVAMAAVGFDARHAAMVFGGMLGVQAAMALLMGLLYAALSRGTVSASNGFVYALTSYLPGLLMQSGVVFLSAPVLSAHWHDAEAVERRAKLAKLSAAGKAADLQAAVEQMSEAEDIAGMAVRAGDSVVGSGIWQRDPNAACRRAETLMRSGDLTIELFATGETALWVEHGDDMTIAVSLKTSESEYIARKAAAMVRRMLNDTSFASSTTMPAGEQ